MLASSAAASFLLRYRLLCHFGVLLPLFLPGLVNRELLSCLFSTNYTTTGRPLAPSPLLLPYSPILLRLLGGRCPFAGQPIAYARHNHACQEWVLPYLLLLVI